jgi:hypothetical protein
MKEVLHERLGEMPSTAVSHLKFKDNKMAVCKDDRIGGWE